MLKNSLSALWKELGFRLVEEHDDPRAFGNAVFVFQSTDLSLRVSRDRGQLFVDVGPADFGEWFDLKGVMDFLGYGNSESSEFEPNELVRLLQVHALELKALFANGKHSPTIGKLKQFELEKTKKRFPGIFDE